MPGEPQVCTAVVSVLCFLCLVLNLIGAASFPDLDTGHPAPTWWYTLTGGGRGSLLLSLHETCRGNQDSCVLLSRGPVAGRFDFPAPASPCQVDFQASAEFRAAVEGGGAAATLLFLSMACSALLMAVSCIATNNHCLAARDGAAARLQCAPLADQRLAVALGALASGLNLAGAAVGWATVGGFAKWLSAQPMVDGRAGGPYLFLTLKSESGSWLPGVALAGNLLVLYLAVQALQAPPPQAQQLVEGSDHEPSEDAAAGAGRATAVSLP